MLSNMLVNISSHFHGMPDRSQLTRPSVTIVAREGGCGSWWVGLSDLDACQAVRQMLVDAGFVEAAFVFELAERAGRVSLGMCGMNALARVPDGSLSA